MVDENGLILRESALFQFGQSGSLQIEDSINYYSKKNTVGGQKLEAFFTSEELLDLAYAKVELYNDAGEIVESILTIPALAENNSGDLNISSNALQAQTYQLQVTRYFKDGTHSVDPLLDYDPFNVDSGYSQKLIFSRNEVDADAATLTASSNDGAFTGLSIQGELQGSNWVFDVPLTIASQTVNFEITFTKNGQEVGRVSDAAEFDVFEKVNGEVLLVGETRYESEERSGLTLTDPSFLEALQNQAINIDDVDYLELAMFDQVNGTFVSSNIRTYPAAYDQYLGQLNAVIDNSVGSGKYELQIDVRLHSGESQRILHEVVLGKVEQTLSWQVPEGFTGAEFAQLVVTESGSGAIIETTDILVSGDRFELVINDLLPGQSYDYEITYDNNARTAFQSLDQYVVSGQFVAGKNGSTVTSTGERKTLVSSASEGFSLAEVFSSQEWDSIYKVTSEIYRLEDDSADALIQSLETYSDSTGAGDINLFIGDNISDGQYRVVFKTHYKNGEFVESSELFEVGQQIESQRLTKVAIDGPENVEGTLVYRAFGDENWLAAEQVLGQSPFFVIEDLQAGRHNFEIAFQKDGELTNQSIISVFADNASHEYVLRPDSVTVPSGRENFYLHDADGNRVAEIDAAGRLVEHRFNAGGQKIASIWYANTSSLIPGANTKLDDIRPEASDKDIHEYYHYDELGRLAATIDGESYLNLNEYDANNRVVRTTRFDAQILKPSQSLSSILTLMDKVDQQWTEYSYDALNRLEAEINNFGQKTLYQFDEDGQVVRRVTEDTDSGNKRIQLNEFDQFGRTVASLTGESAAYYESQGLEQRAQIWKDLATEYVYNDSNQLVSIKRPISSDKDLQNVTRGTDHLFYNDKGELEYQISASGNITKNSFDLQGRLRSVTQLNNKLALGSVLPSDGKVNTVLTSIVDALVSNQDLTESFEYDKLDRVTRTSDTEGRLENRAFNAFGQLTELVKRIDAQRGIDQKTQFKYTNDGLLFEQFQSEVNSNLSIRRLKNQYDEFGRIEVQFNGLNEARTFEHDKLGRLIGEKSPKGYETTTVYDAFNRVVKQVDAKGNETIFEFDDANSSVSMSTPEGLTVVREQNAFGDLIRIEQADGQIIQYEYDADGKLVLEKGLNADGVTAKTTSMEFDAAKNKIAETNALGVRTEWYYDSEKRVVSSIQDPANQNHTTEYLYDGRGREIAVNNADGSKTELVYNQEDRSTLVKTIDATGTNQVQYFNNENDSLVRIIESGAQGDFVTEHRYDGLGRRVETVNDPQGLAIQTVMEYDDLDRLVKVTENGVKTAHFGYDSDGNQVRQGTIAEYAQYDANQNTISTTDSTGTKVFYWYDNDNRLRFIQKSGFALEEIRYNDLGQEVARIQHVLNQELALPDGSADSRALISYAEVVDHVQLHETDASRITQMRYDEFGNLAWQIDANGYAVFREYDDKQQLVSLKRFANSVIWQDSVNFAINASAEDQNTSFSYDSR